MAHSSQVEQQIKRCRGQGASLAAIKPLGGMEGKAFTTYKPKGWDREMYRPPDEILFEVSWCMYVCMYVCMYLSSHRVSSNDGISFDDDDDDDDDTWILRTHSGKSFYAV